MTPTDPPDTPELSDADELAVHAVLDDEATADERRRVARDPRLRARLAELRVVAEAVAVAPAPAPGDVLARMRATALAAADDTAEVDGEDDDDGAEAAADDGATVASPPADPPPVTALPARRPRRNLPALPAVAAVILVLMVVGVALIATGGSDADQSASSGDTATSFADAASGRDAGASSDGEGTAEAAPDASGGGDAPAAGAPADLGPAGADYADETALRTALEQLSDPTTLRSLQVEGADETARSAAAERCGTVLQGADAALEAVAASALVTLDGDDVLVLSTPRAATRDTEASTRIYAVEPSSCVPLLGVDR